MNKLSRKTHGTVIVYYWATETEGRRYKLNGHTIKQRLNFLIKHVKRCGRAAVRIVSFKDGVALVDSQGNRLYYATSPKEGSNTIGFDKRKKNRWSNRRKPAGWHKEAGVPLIERMHEVYDYDN